MFTFGVHKDLSGVCPHGRSRLQNKNHKHLEVFVFIFLTSPSSLVADKRFYRVLALRLLLALRLTAERSMILDPPARSAYGASTTPSVTGNSLAITAMALCAPATRTSSAIVHTHPYPPHEQQRVRSGGHMTSCESHPLVGSWQSFTEFQYTISVCLPATRVVVLTRQPCLLEFRKVLKGIYICGSSIDEVYRVVYCALIGILCVSR